MKHKKEYYKMPKLEVGDIMAIVTGSVLFLFIVGIIFYYLIFVKTTTFEGAIKSYEQLDPYERDKFRKYMMFIDQDVQNKRQLMDSPMYLERRPYNYQNVVNNNDSYRNTNDQILNQVSADTLLTPRR